MTLRYLFLQAALRRSQRRAYRAPLDVHCTTLPCTSCPQHVLVPRAVAEEGLAAKSRLSVVEGELLRRAGEYEELGKQLQVGSCWWLTSMGWEVQDGGAGQGDVCATASR